MRINYLRSEDKFYLMCSGRSNLGCCDASIKVDIRELEDEVAREIRRHLKECPPENVYPVSDAEAGELRLVETRIERLVDALSESSDIAVGYISKQIDTLHRRREELLERMRNVKQETRSIDFDRASFEEKKLIAAEFIEKILLDGKRVSVMWRI